jgi:hypothetical protein
LLKEPASRRKKTVVRAIRITEELDETLRADSESKGISPASLMTSILTKYVEWDRFAERVGIVSIPRNLMVHLVDAPSYENFQKIFPIGAEEIRSFAEFWFGQFNPDTFWRSLELLGKYGGIFQAEVRRDQRRFNVTLHHVLGQRWSDYLSDTITLALEQLGATLLSSSTTTQTVVLSGEKM